MSFRFITCSELETFKRRPESDLPWRGGRTQQTTGGWWRTTVFLEPLIAPPTQEKNAKRPDVVRLWSPPGKPPPSAVTGIQGADIGALCAGAARPKVAHLFGVVVRLD